MTPEAIQTRRTAFTSFSSSRIMRLLLLLSSIAFIANAFTNPERASVTSRPVASPYSTVTPPEPHRHLVNNDDNNRRKHSLFMAYSPPEDAEKTKTTKKKLPTPKIGDVVRYFDVDGGRSDGQVLVGKISLIQPILPPSGSTSTPPNESDGTNKWLVEITEMEDVGDGYYAEYPSRKRRRSALRKLEEIAPLPASFVRSEDAFKIPTERGTNRPLPSHPGYDLLAYEGPAAIPVNAEVVKADGENYGKIKFELLRNAAIAGAAGTIFADLFRGTEDAVIYAAGALAGVAYLFFLGIKTDTVGSADAKLGSNVSNLRFVFPVLVLTGVALKNAMSGDVSPVPSPGLFSTVTPEQFGAAMIGFLTYRVPLFVSQLAPVLSESATDMIPGSAGVAMRMAADAKQRGIDVSSLDTRPGDDLVPVLLVSGPEGTGKTTLVKKLLESDSRFVEPILLDQVRDGAKFERLLAREEFLEMDPSGRFGLAKEGVLEAAAKASEGSDGSDGSDGEESTKKVVVVDASVDLAKKLVNVPGARLIGVWIGLDSLEKFQSRLKAKIDSGALSIPNDETEESFLRARVRQVVKDIEFGVVSGLFEFTILNEDIDDSLRQLKEAAEYCFK